MIEGGGEEGGEDKASTLRDFRRVYPRLEVLDDNGQGRLPFEV